MRSIWDLGEANPPDVAEHLRCRYGRGDLGPKTVGILLRRLVTKGFLHSTPKAVLRGRPPHVYFPLVSEQDALQLQLEKFLQDHKIDDERLADALGRKDLLKKQD